MFTPSLNPFWMGPSCLDRVASDRLEALGAITKISGLRFENFLVSNGSRQVRKVSFHSTRKTSSRSFTAL